MGQPLASLVIDLAATTPEEVEARRVLHKIYLLSCVITRCQLKESIVKKGHGVLVPLIRDVPVLLEEGELAAK